MNVFTELVVHAVEFQTTSDFSQSSQTSVGTSQPENQVSTIERTTGGGQTMGSWLAGGSWALDGQQL